jgi:hypothetical protein
MVDSYVKIWEKSKSEVKTPKNKKIMQLSGKHGKYFSTTT